MFVIPAIDIMNGKCVRLVQGNFAQAKIYRDNPVEVAKEFEKQGAKFLHIIDLDGARLGYPVNLKTILSLAKSVNIPIQVGGGIRFYGQAEKYLQNGVEKVIFGTMAAENPKLLEKIFGKFENGRVIVAIDFVKRQIFTRGWTEKSPKPFTALVNFLKKLSLTTVIVTDITKDGLFQGPNFDLAKEFINKGFQTIMAGGISSLEDLERLNKLGASGVIIGKAIYEKKINLRKAQEKLAYRNNLAKRIISCLDVKNGRVVKGTHFKKLREAGDPVELGKKYSKLGADELVLLDIAATLENRKTPCNLVSKIAREINIPFTVGGGISTLEDINNLLKAGADKVSLCSAVVENPNFVKKAAKYFGSQCIVISIDVKREGEGWKIYIKGGTQGTKFDAIEFSKQMEKLGAGELFVNSLDYDGTKQGFDLELLKIITNNVNIPVIASSGAGSKYDFLEVFQKTGADGALGASVFHYGEIEIPELKKFLVSHNIPVRL